MRAPQTTGPPGVSVREQLVDAAGVDDTDVGVEEGVLETQRSGDGRLDAGGRLPHAAVSVDPGDDTGDGAAGMNGRAALPSSGSAVTRRGK